MYNQYIKRLLDILLSVIAIILLFIPMLLIAAWIKTDDPQGSVFFRQTRIGRNGKKFRILKFRSMRSDTPKHLPAYAMSQAEYRKHITKPGRILRQTSLDELPQVFNILRGDMSFVGPRPVLAKEKMLLDARERAGLRFFRPGLTGWAQINGRNTLTDMEKAQYDGEYVGRISLWFDLYCILKTIHVVVAKKGFLEGTKDRIDLDADFGTGDEFLLSEECKNLDKLQHDDTAS
jgi:O-antigen biosynthesis protein WbqP